MLDQRLLNSLETKFNMLIQQDYNNLEKLKSDENLKIDTVSYNTIKEEIYGIGMLITIFNNIIQSDVPIAEYNDRINKVMSRLTDAEFDIETYLTDDLCTIPNKYLHKLWLEDHNLTYIIQDIVSVLNILSHVNLTLTSVENIKVFKYVNNIFDKIYQKFTNQYNIVKNTLTQLIDHLTLN